MTPTKASRDRHIKFRTRVGDMLTKQGAKVVEDSDSTLKFVLPTKRIGDLEFTVFKRDGEQGNRPSRESYCLFIRLGYEQDDYSRKVVLVQDGYGQMSASGKWNLLHSDPQDVYDELSRRLEWLMS